MSELPICECSVGWPEKGHAPDCPVRLEIERLRADIKLMKEQLGVANSLFTTTAALLDEHEYRRLRDDVQHLRSALREIIVQHLRSALREIIDQDEVAEARVIDGAHGGSYEGQLDDEIQEVVDAIEWEIESRKVVSDE